MAEAKSAALPLGCAPTAAAGVQGRDLTSAGRAGISSTPNSAPASYPLTAATHAVIDVSRNIPYIFPWVRRAHAMSTLIEKTSTITAKGQTTVPKAVRQVLGVGLGGRITYRIEDGLVTVHNPEAGHRDPALAAYLALIEKDIAAGRNLGDLPAGLGAALQRAGKEIPVDLDETLEGEVAL